MPLAATIGPRITSPTSITQERTEGGPIMRVDRDAQTVAVVKMRAVPVRPSTEVISCRPAGAGSPCRLSTGHLQQPEFPGPVYRGGPVGSFEFAVQSALVCLDGIDRDIKVRADLAPRQRRRQEAKDLEFLAGELLAERGPGPVPRHPAIRQMLRRGEQLPGEAGIPAVPQDSAGLRHAGPGCVPVAEVLADLRARQQG